MENTPQLSLPGYINFLSGPLTGKIYQITRSDFFIGNDQSCDIVVPDPTLAPQHVQLTWNNWQWHLKKLAPQNHVAVNTHEVQEATIKHYDVISLSENTAFVLLLDALNITEPLGNQYNWEKTRPVSLPDEKQHMTTSNLSLETIPYLSIIDYDKTQKHFRTQRNFLLKKPAIDVGRDPSNDIVLKYATVSDYHLRITKDVDHVHLLPSTSLQKENLQWSCTRHENL